jgi:preprotein translocase subunit SecD
VTLTLAGIAGFVLSVGMAVDANVLIFERLKEELRWGKSLGGAIDEGFKRAWTSIRDSNVSSLITCGVLFWLGTSIIKGFALTLAIGILVSMFSAIFVTRNFLQLVVSEKMERKLWWFGVKKK